MQFDYPLLEALGAVIREGSFAAAAESLNVTQSAISQRVRLLEERTGSILVVRGRPCVATEYGQRLCRHIEQVQLLEHDLLRRLTPLEKDAISRRAVARVAVNRDSLATWFPEVVQRAASELNLNFDIFPDDQEYTLEKLRQGEVLAAITTEEDMPYGCKKVPLGALEYIAIAAPELVHRHFRDGVTATSLASAPCITFDRKDTLPQQWMMNAIHSTVRTEAHFVPSFTGYLACCLNGAGWGLMPRHSVLAELKNGDLVELEHGSSVILHLYWQSSALSSDIMKRLSVLVRQVSGRYLWQPKINREAG